MTLVVKTDDLGRVLQHWIDAHEIRNPNAKTEMKSISGRQYISIKSGVGPHRITAILDRRSEHVPFDLADKLLCGIGEQAEFHMSVIPIEA